MSSLSSGPDPKVAKYLEKLVIGADRTAWTSFVISVLAILVAGTSAWYAYQNSIDDEHWKSRQIELLEDISRKLDAP